MRKRTERNTRSWRAPWRNAAGWRVVATLALVLTSGGMVAWGDQIPGAFAQDAVVAPPAAPGLAAPANGATVADAWRDVDLQWEAVPGAVEYQVILNDGERTGPWVAETSWSPGSLPEGAYQWSVRARNDAGVGAPGQDFTFTIAPEETAMEPLPFPLQQQAAPLDVQIVGDNATTAMTDTQVSSPGTVNGAPVIDAVPAVQEPTTAATPVPAGTPAPVAAPTDSATVDGADGADGGDGSGGGSGGEGGDGGAGGAGRDGRESADGADSQPGQDGQDGQPGADANVVSDDGGGSDNKDSDERARDERERKDREEREKRERGGRTDSNGNGGVSEVIAVPPQIGYLAEWPVELTQARLAQEDQNGTTSTAGATGQDGTVNGQPRENNDPAPAVTTGPGVPLAPAGVILPPSVPGVDAGAAATAPGVDPAFAAGIGGTTELAFNAAADTTVFTSEPNTSQSPESAGLLAIGGSQGAVSLISFDVSGIGEGTVLSALLNFTGGGEVGAPGGGVRVLYDYVVPEGLTANGVPDGGSALNVHGAPSWFEEVEPGGITSVDVTGSVSGDGQITFVLPGQAEATGSIYASESGIAPQLVLNVALPG